MIPGRRFTGAQPAAAATAVAAVTAVGAVLLSACAHVPGGEPHLGPVELTEPAHAESYACVATELDLLGFDLTVRDPDRQWLRARRVAPRSNGAQNNTVEESVSARVEAAEDERESPLLRVVVSVESEDAAPRVDPIRGVSRLPSPIRQVQPSRSTIDEVRGVVMRCGLSPFTAAR